MPNKVAQIIKLQGILKKTPNKVAEGNDEEDSDPNEFQDSVLSCLGDLQRLATIMKEKAEMMEHSIKRFRASIHGEDIDA
jgi:hypothetical protein